MCNFSQQTKEIHTENEKFSSSVAGGKAVARPAKSKSKMASSIHSSRKKESVSQKDQVLLKKESNKTEYNLNRFSFLLHESLNKLWLNY